VKTRLTDSKYARALEQYLGTSKYLITLLLDSRLYISDSSPSFARLLRLKKNPTGASIHSFLLPESRNALASILDQASARIRLILTSPFSPCFPVDCHVFKVDEDHLLFGDHLMLTNDDSLNKMSTLNSELINLTRELQRKNRALENAREKIKVLGGLLPICSSCKKIRDDEGYWNQIESYIRDHSEADFSHSICPDCARMLYPDLYDKLLE
jgi:hypothetical protein